MSAPTYDHDDPSNGYEEPEETQLRLKLGVRPTWYRDGKHDHPHARPCPTWCCHADRPGGHDIESDHPMTPEHSLGIAVDTVASHYVGDREKVGDGWVVNTARLSADLQQLGDGEPQVQVALHHYVEGRHRCEERLRLSIEDARDLMTALRYVIELADDQR
ncbi:hypothetical protein [Nocardioides sp. cx-173]|uniref:hypothetical protein n=1 Tax=Nocardioides sp. cx-173 TaxID=2898796 RepID=UPI001E3A256D|nr:hypothetical protein [Nocardioides sp. cx-173]MCD4525248.1 hypothetical protein [Nocardioides sp. cx-173]UGB40949.1 hypothetical protein LQ940_16425 [Nocardioides sp. cx-173]